MVLKQILGFPDYLAGDDGYIYSTVYSSIPKRLSSFAKKPGRLAVDIWANGKKRQPLVHVLVCAAFHGPKPAGKEVRHLNGVSTENAASNLMWGTRRENADDEIFLGKRLGKGGPKLSLSERISIHAASGSKARIARDFGVHVDTVRAIKSGKYASL